MKIAVVSIMFKQTPPPAYGGIERVVYNLVEALARGGHEVTMFATPGSYCSGKTVVVPAYDPSQAPSGIIKRSDAVSEEPLYETMRDYLRENPVDVIHDWSFESLFVRRHPEAFPFVVSTCIPPPPGFQRPNLVACSRAHAQLCGGTTKHVYYGLDLDSYRYDFQKENHFIHISKIARYKGQHLAILAAVRSRSRLAVAGNVEDKLYYHGAIRPLTFLFPKYVQYIGELPGTNDQLRRARALVQTPRWFDAFPLVILESFASGTPVIALEEGGIPEQIDSGINGYLCRSIDDLAGAMENIGRIEPRTCRRYAEEYYRSDRMAKDYIDLYNQVRDGDGW
ncbi:MAG: glycosyltransferase [Pseudomonadota bacterium]|nr:glycosyltransferase [Pseudomonadota bacterium]